MSKLPSGGGTRICKAAVKSVAEDGVYRWTISTSAVDDEGEVLVPRGCNYGDFLKQGGAMYWWHDTSEFPLAKIKSITTTANAVEADIVFPPRPDSLPEGTEWGPDYMRALVDAEMVQAVSVGFARQVDGTRKATDADKSKYGDGAQWVTNKWKLGEVSFTTIPVNPEAIRKAVESRDGLTLAGCKAALGLDVKVEPEQAPERKSHRIVVRVPERGALGDIEVKAARAIALAKGRVYLP